MTLRMIILLLVCGLAGLVALPQNPATKSAAPRTPTKKPALTVAATAQYDNARTGAKLLETTLTPQNVNAGQFGRVAWFSVDGDVCAQPL
jgi:hypothetical protein